MTSFRCVIHGSFSKHFDQIKKSMETFNAAGIEVLAPSNGDLVADVDGFSLFENEVGKDPRLIELLYLQNLKKYGHRTI